jgi:hypothetical protein
MPKISDLPPITGVEPRDANPILGNLLPMVDQPGTAQAETQKITLNQMVFLIHGTIFYYRANLTQLGTNAPIETVLVSSFPQIVWTRIGVGRYAGTASGTFPLNRTFLMINNLHSNLVTPSMCSLFRVDDNSINIHTRTGKDLLFTDGLLLETSLMVMLYPLGGAGAKIPFDKP